MAWSCARCGQAVDWLGDPISGVEGRPLCYNCAEDEAGERTDLDHYERAISVLRDVLVWMERSPRETILMAYSGRTTEEIVDALREVVQPNT